MTLGFSPASLSAAQINNLCENIIFLVQITMFINTISCHLIWGSFIMTKMVVLAPGDDQLQCVALISLQSLVLLSLFLLHLNTFIMTLGRQTFENKRMRVSEMYIKGFAFARLWKNPGRVKREVRVLRYIMWPLAFGLKKAPIWALTCQATGPQLLICEFSLL